MAEGMSRLGYVPELDGLRGAAIIGVMAFHANLLNGGFIGVDLFFVLSGFLITTLLAHEFDKFGSINLTNFYARRALRLSPALIAMLAVVCLASFAFLDKERAHGNFIEAVIAFFYVGNILQAFSMYDFYFISHTWSLAIEEQFYIVWPIMLFILLRVSKNMRHIAFVALFLATLSLFSRIYLSTNGALPVRLYYGFDTRSGALMVGSALGIAQYAGFFTKNEKKLFYKTIPLMAYVAILSIIYFSITGDIVDSKMYYFGFLIVEIAAAFLIVNVLMNARSVISRLLAAKWLVWVGSISYGLYLWHAPIYRSMSILGFSDIALFTIGSPLTFLAASFSYYCMERPILNFKKRFSRSAQADVPPPASAPLPHADAVDV